MMINLKKKEEKKEKVEINEEHKKWEVFLNNKEKIVYTSPIIKKSGLSSKKETIDIN